MNYFNIFLIDNGGRIGVGAGSGMGFRPVATDLEFKKPGIRALRIEELALLGGMAPALLFDSLIWMELAKFYVIDFCEKQQGGFFS